MSARKKQKSSPAPTGTQRPTPAASAQGGSPTAPTAPSSGRWIAIRALLALALALSAYLAYVSLTGQKAVGCGPDSGCDRVLASRWAYWFGIPVSAFALAVDAALLALTFQLPRTFKSRDASADRPWLLARTGALLLAGAALWFVALQIGVVQSLCPYCMAAHGAGFVAALLLWFTPSPRPIPLRLPATFAAASLALLATGQLAHSPKTFELATVNSPTNSTASTPASNLNPAPTAAPASTNPPPANARPSRLFPAYNGQFQIDVMDVPTLGHPTNAQVMIALHDFTCSHCRETHPHLLEAYKTFPKQLVIVTLPMPFDPACNPIMQRPNAKHANACEYARLSLAVWRVDPAKHHEFDDFLFTGKNAPPVPEARAAAVRLIGAERLDQALADPWVDRTIKLGVDLYITAYRAGQGSMPQMIIGPNVAVGSLSRADLFGLLARNLGLTPPAAPTP